MNMFMETDFVLRKNVSDFENFLKVTQFIVPKPLFY